jgi:murein DD-endopeptidase MepM/ murein hydrolase activator NlpD
MRLASLLSHRLVALLVLTCLIIGWPGSPALEQASAESAAGVRGAQAPYDVQAFLERQPGVLKSYREGQYSASQIIEGYSTYYNLDPRVLLALLELVPRLLSEPAPAPETLVHPFGTDGPRSLAAHLDWVAREIRAGFGPYDEAPVVRFTDGTTAVLSLDQDPSLLAVQRFVARGRTEAEWNTLKGAYEPLFSNLFGARPETVTPSPEPPIGRPFLQLPWVEYYPDVPGDPLAGKRVRVVHSSYFDHVYPTVDLGPDGNDFIVTFDNRGAVSYNSHDGHDYYFTDRPIGTPIVAAADGVAYAYTARGNGVVIRHGGAYAGYETVYWHLDAFEQKFTGKIDNGIGVPVRAGDFLGTSGKSGFVVGGAHLHFEVRRNGRQVDPYGWFGPGEDPCAAWVAGCEASVWLWHPDLIGKYDFTPPNAPAPRDTEPPVGTLSVITDPDLALLAHFDGHPVQSIGRGTPTLGGPAALDLEYEDGVFDQAVQVPVDMSLTYPISGNLSLEAGTLALWARIPDQYPRNGTGRHYIVAASNNPGDSATGVYTGTFSLRRQVDDDVPAWNFWTVDGAGQRHDLVVTDTLTAGWHHFAISWERQITATVATKHLYIDGELVASAADATMPDFVGERLEMGRWTPGFGASNMALDELAVFRRALTGIEIGRLADQRDYLTAEPGPLSSEAVVGTRAVELDTNAIDRQGGIVSVRLRRDNEPWGQPLPYYDSYRWSITGTHGLHTFAVEYRDRADNVTVETATVMFAEPVTSTVTIGDAFARA